MSLLRTTSLLAIATVSFALGACDRAAPTPAPIATVVPAAAPKHEPTAARVTERCAERWSKIEKQDWVAAYDMLAPEPKRALMLAQFLAQKQPHEYKSPKVVEVLKVDGDLAFVRTTAMWTPHHPEIAQLKDPESIAEMKRRFPEKVEQIETWRFAEGDWGWLEAKAPVDFFKDHPEFLRASGDAAVPKSADASAAAPKQG